MKQQLIETITGIIVIIIATIFLIFAYNKSRGAKTSDGYNLQVYFQNIEGVQEGADVKLSGIKIGYVKAITLDTTSFDAVVTLKIANDIPIPKDSRAIVTTSGLIGGKYISINPGASDINLSDNDRIKLTQSSLNFEDLIAKLMYSITSK
ncbi:MAG: outer membrane lipid asymmetry maintenance protein MlaD [Rickettsiaceae bacterium]|nr:outer membrane lipid asymmetry maintenance protein MlaD [Rickettsiaceae bacterium]